MSKRRERDELAGLLPRERVEVLRRERIVCELGELQALGKLRGFKAHDVARTYSEMLRSRGVKVSPSTLWAWRKAYRSDGPAGLIDQRLCRHRQRPLERRCPAFLDFFAFWYQKQDPALTADALARKRFLRGSFFNASLGARMFGWRTCTFREASAWLVATIRRVRESLDRSALGDGSPPPKLWLVQGRPKTDRTAFNGGSADN